MNAKSYKHFCGCDSHNRPINPYNGEIASVTNERNWGFEEDVKSDRKGIMLGKSQYNDPGTLPLVLVRVTGEDLTAEMEATLDTYHQGGEFICQVDDDTQLIRRGMDHVSDTKHGTIEIQEKNYFLPLSETGSGDLKNCTTQLRYIVDKYFDKSLTIFQPTKEKISDEEAIKKADEDDTFKDCYRGLWQEHMDTKKEASEYVCRLLAFYTDGNRSQVERLFRDSGLMDEHFEEMDAMGKYDGEKMITKVCAEHKMQGDKYSDDIDTSLAYKMDMAAKNAIALQKAKVAEKITDVKYDYSDTGNARRLYDFIGNMVHCVEGSSAWYYYSADEGRFISDKGTLVMKAVDQMLDDMKEEIQYLPSHKQEDYYKHVIKSQKHNNKIAMVEELKHMGNVPIQSREVFDTDDMILNVKNGTVDLKTGKLMPHSPEYMCSHMCPIEYNEHEDREPVKFLGYLKQWIPDDEVRAWIKKQLGYTLTGMTSEQCMYFLLGIGQDGKSTMMQILSEIMGDYACYSQPETFMMKSFVSSSGPSSDVARLCGKRLVYTEEATEGVRLNEGLVKALTGGEVQTARFMRENEFEFRPRFKIWMPTNYTPTVRGTDKGIQRRLMIVRFPNSIKDEDVDKKLVYNLRKEYPLILKWLIDGAVAWYNEDSGKHTNPPAAVCEEKEKYMAEMDIVRTFLEACTEEAEDGKLNIYELHGYFIRWAREAKEYEMPRRKFVKEIKKYCDTKGFECKPSTKNQPYIFGLALNEEGTNYRNYNKEFDPKFEKKD